MKNLSRMFVAYWRIRPKGHCLFIITKLARQWSRGPDFSKHTTLIKDPFSCITSNFQCLLSFFILNTAFSSIQNEVDVRHFESCPFTNTPRWRQLSNRELRGVLHNQNVDRSGVKVFRFVLFVLSLGSKGWVCIFHECEVQTEKSVPRVTVRHHQACRMMSNNYPEERTFLSAPNAILDSFPWIPFDIIQLST